MRLAVEKVVVPLDNIFWKKSLLQKSTTVLEE